MKLVPDEGCRGEKGHCSCSTMKEASSMTTTRKDNEEDGGRWSRSG